MEFNVPIIALIITAAIALVSTFFTLKDTNHRLTRWGYSLIALTFLACGLGIYNSLDDDRKKDELNQRLLTSENREKKALEKIESLTSEIDRVNAVNATLTETVGRLEFMLSDQTNPNDYIVVRTTYIFNATHPTINTLRNVVFDSSDTLIKNDSAAGSIGYVKRHDGEWLFSTRPKEFYIYAGLANPQYCNLVPGFCHTKNGLTVDYFDILIASHLTTTVLYFNYQHENLEEDWALYKSYLPPDMAAKCDEGITSACRTTLLSELALQDNVPNGQVSFRIIEPFRKLKHSNMPGMNSLSRATVSIKPFYFFEGYQDLLSSITIDIMDDQNIIETFRIGPVDIKKVNPSHLNDRSNRVFLSSSE